MLPSHKLASPQAMQPNLRLTVRTYPLDEPPEFLQARLERALAVPAAERGLDVAAFIEVCRLHQEAHELMDAAMRVELGARRIVDHCGAMQAGLRLVRAHYVSPLFELRYVLSLPLLAHALLGHIIAKGQPGRNISEAVYLERLHTALADSEPSLDFAVAFAAALAYAQAPRPIPTTAAGQPLFSMRELHELVARLCAPARRRGLQEQLAALQAGQAEPVLTVEQLLAALVSFAGKIAASDPSVNATPDAMAMMR